MDVDPYTNIRLTEYEHISEILKKQRITADWVNVESFLNSDLTYSEWTNKFFHEKIHQIDLDKLIQVQIPHFYGGTLVSEYHVEPKPLSLHEQQLLLLKDAYQALSAYKKTGDQHELLAFKKLFAKYRELLKRTDRKFRRLIGQIKAKLRQGYSFNLRDMVRIRMKMIARNIDDEDNGSKNSFVNQINLLLQTINHHEYPKYTTYNRQPPVLYGTYGQ